MYVPQFILRTENIKPSYDSSIAEKDMSLETHLADPKPLRI